MFKPLKYKYQPLRLLKPLTSPEFGAKTVLVEDPWEYVSRWLRREGHSQATFFWEQAREFYEATTVLSPMSSPLPAYYSMLNAVKTLFAVRGRQYRHIHGVRGNRNKGRWSLASERIELLESGVIPELCDYLDEPYKNVDYTLKQALYNLPWIHRAYSLTYRSDPELFIPLEYPRFVTRDGEDKAWFCAKVSENFASGHTTKKLPNDYERTPEENAIFAEDAYIVRRKSTFDWRYHAGRTKQNLKNLIKYHRDTRRQIFYIRGPERLWYLKRDDTVDDVLSRSSLTLTITAMHRLCDLSRYDPVRLSKHLEKHHHNWLLSEFVGMATKQFADEMASEITGREFMPPGIRK